MDQQQEHIATLCAAGTVGIAATGLVLASQEDGSPYFIVPGKRKWPGAASVQSPSPPRTPFVLRRAASQPGTSHGHPNDAPSTTISNSGSGKRNLLEVRPEDTGHDGLIESRASSLNRYRPRTALSKPTSVRRDTSTGSSWLKRISTVSSIGGSSSATSFLQSKSVAVPTDKVRPLTSHHMPNKLVKRSTSHRGLSFDQAKGSIFRRPATSHQRSAVLQDFDQEKGRPTPTETQFDPLQEDEQNPDTFASSWRPYFITARPSKRQSLPTPSEASDLRLIAAPGGHPTLVMSSQVERMEQHIATRLLHEMPAAEHTRSTMSTGRHKLRRSLSSMQRASRRRFFTEPTTKVANDTANGTMSAAFQNSPISPISNVSTFDMDVRHDSPAFGSSPLFIPVKHRFSLRKRESTAPSDPATISSDNDTRIFTDDESMDFHSDTAYDSLATRATVSSHSAGRSQKLDMMFNGSSSPLPDERKLTLEQLMQRASLAGESIDDGNPFSTQASNHGIGIHSLHQVDGPDTSLTDESASLTPVKSVSPSTDEVFTTPIPIKNWPVTHRAQRPLSESLPSSSFVLPVRHEEVTAITPDMATVEEEEIDWSPKSDIEHAPGPTKQSDVTTDAKLGLDFDTHQDQVPVALGLLDGEMRTSIFDWSEHQRQSDASQGSDARPKTVHGKQVNDNIRSRSSGRKAPNQMHMRSLSVPTHRDPQSEPASLPPSKFGTWGLGHKPVSEEWNDDFEFDDDNVEETSQHITASVVAEIPSSSQRGSVRGVRVPQAIIDRQASVHSQFSQVQEFMMWVEELKRLRIRGASLGLLNAGTKQLWEDAESIINLATINEEEDAFGHMRTRSPTSPDVFGDDTPLTSRSSNVLGTDEDGGLTVTAQRSLSSPVTPPFGRPRGESLAQAKNFLQTIHQHRNGAESSPNTEGIELQKKLPFDTQDLKDLVVRSGAITRALKEMVRKAEGVSVSPAKTPPRNKDPAFSQIFNPLETSPCPPYRQTGLPKSKSANNYLASSFESKHTNGDVSTSFTLTAMV